MQTFSKSLWEKATPEERGAMLYNFIQKNYPIKGKKKKFITEQLGKSTAYYLYDEIPAYKITSTTSDKPNTLIVFLIDWNSGKIKDYSIIKEF